MNLYAILAAVAVVILAVSEILISIQKSQMKRQFLDELDRSDGSKDNHESRSSKFSADDKRD